MATTSRFPEPKEGMPHDANARAGMIGHAGFGATPESARAWLNQWIKKYSPLMAAETCRSRDGEIWGLGLQRLRNGTNGFAELLNAKTMEGVNVVFHTGSDEPPPLDPHVPTDASDWWFHFGYTGPAIFVRPDDGVCVALLCHRLKETPGLLSADTLRARRWQMLDNFIKCS
jgi:hypothetical protein